MAHPLETLLRDWPKPYLCDSDIAIFLPSSANSRFSRVKRALACHNLISARKGLYIIGENLRGNRPLINPYEIAATLYSPSFISFESALSYHGLIPEAVHSITCASTKRKKSYTTPIGYFTYQTVPKMRFYEEVERISQNNSEFFMAKPWRAICDYIYCNKLKWTNLSPLHKSLRIELEELPPLSHETKNSLINYYQNTRIKLFLSNVYQEMNYEH